MRPRYRLGIDIGGTFTDATLIDEDTGAVGIVKVSSTPRDPSIGFIEAVERMLRQAGVSPAGVAYVVHGTTVATNSIIEGKTARSAFVTTDGFRDILEIALGIRPAVYDLQFEKLRPLVPRHLCFGVPERLDARGNVLVPLDEAAVHRVGEQLRREGVESIAVCLLHSYVNPSHERRVGEILGEVFPEAVISLSSEVAPEIREYLRASTTVINACIRPVVSRYLENIETRLRDVGLSAELLVMQSSGGVYSSAAAAEKPVFMVESGPAAGVIAAAYLGATLGYEDVISFDMGGTTAKTALIHEGTPKVTKDYQVGSTAGTGTAGRKSMTGYPIRTPVIDLVEIGAGGGSIAWVDSGGMLRVGPQSAGAEPGPVCYGKGGVEPTVTDANLLLGRLNPRYFLGGEIELDVERARAAIQERCADRLGLDVVTTAHGIVEIANTAMVNAMRLISVQRGYDPREFVMIAFGGAGPAHANGLAAEAEIPVTLVPPSPGITSATGLLVTDLKHDHTAAFLERADRLDAGLLEQSYRRLEEAGRAELEREGVRPSAMAFVRQADVRYVGQSYELTVPVPAGGLGPPEVAGLVERFHREHERAYGHSAPEEPTELVNLRLTAIGAIAKPQLAEVAANGRDPQAARKESRPVYFAESGGYVDCPIFDRYRLGAGCVLEGPAIVEELDSTTVIHPGYSAAVDSRGNLLLSRG